MDGIIYAAQCNDLKRVKLLLKQQCPSWLINEAFEQALYHGYEVVANELIENGADIRFNNDTPLKIAVCNSSLEFVNKLIEGGANIHANDYYPLSLCAKYTQGNCEVLKRLIELGADVNYDNNQPLRLAVEYNQIDAVNVLLDAGCKVTDEIIESTKNDEIKEVLCRVQRRHIKSAGKKIF
jgi:ankyrin repeat protein